MPVSVSVFQICQPLTNLVQYVLGEVGKLLGAKWKELDDEEKKVYFAATDQLT